MTLGSETLTARETARGSAPREAGKARRRFLQFALLAGEIMPLWLPHRLRACRPIES